MRNLMNDVVTVMHIDGTKQEDIRASVQEEQIIIDDATVPIFVGDRIERRLPSGQEEVLIVTKVHLWRGTSRIPDFYKISYEREGNQHRHSQPTTVNVNVSDSPQARINLNSTDQSTNTIHQQAEEVFSQIRRLLSESITDSPDLDLLLERVKDMESSIGSDDFTKAYKDFLATAANHMTVLAPVLPVLAALL